MDATPVVPLPVSRERAFTLVEVLVASLILALALIALSSLFALGIKNNAVAKEDTVMAAFAQDKLEELKRAPMLEMQQLFKAGCQNPCSSNCAPCSPLPSGCDSTTCCEHICYQRGCPAADRVRKVYEDPIVDPNPLDDVNESLYVRLWSLERVNLGQPVGCVMRITVTVGSRNGILAPRPDPPATSWIDADKDQVIGTKNPRRVIVATYRAK